MLVITVAKLTILVLTAGLTGRYIFAVLPLTLFSTYGVLKKNRPIMYFFGIASILTTIAFAGGYSFLVISLGILALVGLDGLLWLLSANGAFMVNGKNMNALVLQGESYIIDMENEKKLGDDPGKNTGTDLERLQNEEYKFKGSLNMLQQNVNAENKKENESFDFIAAVCSTWIPSVVGDEKQNIFLKAGRQFHIPMGLDMIKQSLYWHEQLKYIL